MEAPLLEALQEAPLLKALQLLEAPLLEALQEAPLLKAQLEGCRSSRPLRLGSLRWGRKSSRRLRVRWGCKRSQ